MRFVPRIDARFVLMLFCTLTISSVMLPELSIMKMMSTGRVS